MDSKTLFISADHGLAIIYFLQSEVVATLLAADHKVVVFTDDAIREKISSKFDHPNLVFEGLRIEECNRYYATVAPERQWWLNFLRRVGSSGRINTEAMDSYIRQVAVEEGRRRRWLMPFGRLAVWILRRSEHSRRWLISAQAHYAPNLYADLFEKYRPSLVIASTPGWRVDRYLLREAASRGIATAAVVVGWDNPSSYSIPGASVDWISCWSQIQKEELVLGSDWPPEKVNIGGIPSYDGYFHKEWQLSRDEYFKLHGLDPNRKLLAYAASFVSFAPNYRNVETLARLVSSDNLVFPAQLLIRLHPNHFQNVHLYREERERIQKLVRELPHVHVVEPVPLGGSLGHYSGEDMPEKSSMMAHADVFLTVYSTMVVETAIHGRPIIAACLDTPGGWNWPKKFSLPLSQIGKWPTHKRFLDSGSGRVAFDEDSLRDAINHYLTNPSADTMERRQFIERECTFTDGSAGRRTGEYLLGILESRVKK
jgi:hypothetical protein